MTKHSLPPWSSTVRDSHRPSWGRYWFILRTTSETIAPESSVTLSGTHFNKYGAWTGGVIEATILRLWLSCLSKVREGALIKSFHLNVVVSLMLLPLKQWPLGCRSSSMTPLVPNSQQRCHALCHRSLFRLEIGWSSLNSLWHLKLRRRRNSWETCCNGRFWALCHINTQTWRQRTKWSQITRLVVFNLL